MRKGLFFCFILLGISLSAMPQSNAICQPDSATIYFDTSFNPQWHYGGVWDFSCEYDADGLLTQLLVSVFHEDECLTRRYQYGYDLNHNQISNHYVGYDCSSPGVDYETKSVFHNNLLQYQLKIDYSLHRGWGTLTDSTYFHYDSKGRRICQESFNGDYVPTTTIRYEYGDNEKVVTTERMEGNQWIAVKRVTYSYSEMGLLLNTMTETSIDGVFANSTLVTNTYDEQNNCIGVLTQKWGNESWNNVKSVVNSYDNGHLVLAKLMKWQDEEFVDANRAVYELNEAGYPIVVNFEKWNGNEWIEGTWISDFSVFSESYLSRQNKELCQVDVRRIELHYIDTPMPDYDVDEHSASQPFATIHPNPATATVTIVGENLKQIEITDMLGQRVATHQAEGPQATIDISALPTGIYFVGITDENGKRCVKKVIKE